MYVGLDPQTPDRGLAMQFIRYMLSDRLISRYMQMSACEIQTNY